MKPLAAGLPQDLSRMTLVLRANLKLRGFGTAPGPQRDDTLVPCTRCPSLVWLGPAKLVLAKAGAVDPTCWPCAYEELKKFPAEAAAKINVDPNRVRNDR